MDDNNARKPKYGMGWQHKGLSRNQVTIINLSSFNELLFQLGLFFLLYNFSMYLSISPKERLDLISSFGKHRLYGTTNTQVLKILAFPFFTSLLLLLNFCDGSASVISFKSIFIILDVEFGRLQARDMLQHLWTGPISNASVDVVQGSRSVEVRAVGVTKVLCILIGSKVLMFQMLNVPKVHNFFFLSLLIYPSMYRVPPLIVS